LELYYLLCRKYNLFNCWMHYGSKSLKLVCTYFLYKHTYEDTYYKLLLLYLLMMVSRFLSIMVVYNILNKHGYGFTFNDALVLTYGGIRGAIGISFSLIISHDSFFDHKFKHILLLHISVCAFLTLIGLFICKSKRYYNEVFNIRTWNG